MDHAHYCDRLNSVHWLPREAEAGHGAVAVAGEPDPYGRGLPHIVAMAARARARARTRTRTQAGGGRDAKSVDTVQKEQSAMKVRDASTVLMLGDTRDAVAAVIDDPRGVGNSGLGSTFPIGLEHLHVPVAGRRGTDSDAHHGDLVLGVTYAGGVSLLLQNMLAPGRLSPRVQALVDDLSRLDICRRMGTVSSQAVRDCIPCLQVQVAVHRLGADMHPRGDPQHLAVVAAWHCRAICRDRLHQVEVPRTFVLVPSRYQQVQTDGADGILAEYHIVACQGLWRSGHGETAQHSLGDHAVWGDRAFGDDERGGIRTTQSAFAAKLASAVHSRARMQAAGRVARSAEGEAESHAKQVEVLPTWPISTWACFRHFLICQENPRQVALDQTRRKQEVLLREERAEEVVGHSSRSPAIVNDDGPAVAAPQIGPARAATSAVEA